MSVTTGRKLQEYARTVDQTARDELVVNHLWLVRHIMGKVAARLPSGVDVDNLESAGMLGLVEAAGRFDTDRGVDFKSFATQRIRGAIFDEARRNCPLPQDVMQRVTQVTKAQERFSGHATVEQLVAETGLSQDEVLDALIAIPLIRPGPLEHVEFDPSDRSSDSPDAAIELEEQKQLLADGIVALPERERLVVSLYYRDDLRLKEIGEVLDLSESRVSRILASAHNRLREYVFRHDNEESS